MNNELENQETKKTLSDFSDGLVSFDRETNDYDDSVEPKKIQEVDEIEVSETNELFQSANANADIDFENTPEIKTSERLSDGAYLVDMDWVKVGRALGYDNSDDELNSLTDDGKRKLYDELAIKVQQQERKKLKGTGLRNQNDIAVQKTLEQLPDSWRTFGLPEPKKPIDLEEEPIRYVKDRLTNYFGQDGNNVKFNDALKQIAIQDIDIAYKGKKLSKEVREAIVNERMQKYQQYLNTNTTNLTLGQFINTESSILTKPLDQSQQQVNNVPESERDGALSYSVDRAQQLFYKGLQTVGDAVEWTWLTDKGKKGVEQQVEDIQKGGYQPKYTKDLVDTYNEDGFLSSLGWIYEKSLENLASGAVAIVGGTAAVLTAPISATGAAVVGGATLGTTTLLGAGGVREELEEQGLYNPDDAEQVVGMGIVIGTIDAVAGRLPGVGNASKNVVKDFAKQNIIKSIGSMAIKTATSKAAQKAATKGVAEGGTEVAQELATIEFAKSKGAKYEDGEIAKRLVESFAVGGAIGAVAGQLPPSKSLGRNNEIESSDGQTSGDDNVSEIISNVTSTQQEVPTEKNFSKVSNSDSPTSIEQVQSVETKSQVDEFIENTITPPKSFVSGNRNIRAIPKPKQVEVRLDNSGRNPKMDSDSVYDLLNDGWIISSKKDNVVAHKTPSSQIAVYTNNKGKMVRSDNPRNDLSLLGNEMYMTKDNATYSLKITGKERNKSLKVKKLGGISPNFYSANIKHPDDDNVNMVSQDSFVFSPIPNHIAFNKKEISGKELVILDPTTAPDAKEIDGNTYEINASNGTYKISTKDNNSVDVEYKDENGKVVNKEIFELDFDDNGVAFLEVDDSRGDNINAFEKLINNGAILKSSTSDGRVVEYAGKDILINNIGTMIDVENNSVLPTSILNESSNPFLKNLNENDDIEESQRKVLEQIFDNDELSENAEVTETEVRYVGDGESDLIIESDLESAKTIVRSVQSNMIGDFVQISDKIDDSELWINSQEQREILRSVVRQFPEHIQNIIHIEFDNKNNHAFETNSYGYFSPYGNGRGPLIYIDAANQGDGRTVRKLIETISEEVGHFSFNSIKNDYISDVYSIMWRDLKEAIRNEPALEPYFPKDKDGNFIEFDQLSDGDKFHLINEFTSKQGIGVLDYEKLGISKIHDVDVKSLANELKSLAESKISLNISSDFSKEDIVEQLYRPLIKANIAWVNDYNPIELEAELDNGKTVVRMRKVPYGKSVTTINNNEKALEAQKIRDEVVSLRWSARPYEQGLNTVMSSMKYYLRQLYKPTLGYELNDLLTNAPRIISQTLRTKFRSAQANALQIESLLESSGFSGKVPYNKDYRKVFDEWGVKRNKANDNLAKFANNFMQESTKAKYSNVGEIHRLLDETFSLYLSRTQDANNEYSGSTADIVFVKRELENFKNRITADWSHRRYDAYTRNGRIRLNRMLKVLEGVTSSDEIRLKEDAIKLKANFIKNNFVGKNKETYQTNLETLQQDIVKLRKRQREGGVSESVINNKILELEYNFAINNPIDNVNDRKTLKRYDDRLTLQSRLSALAEATRLQMINDGVEYDKNSGGYTDKFDTVLLGKMKDRLRDLLKNHRSMKSDLSNTIASVDATYGKTLDPNNHIDQLEMKFLGEIVNPMESMIYDLEQQLSLITTLEYANRTAVELLDMGIARLKKSSANTSKGYKWSDILSKGQKGSLLGLIEVDNAMTDIIQETIDSVNIIRSNSGWESLVAGIKQNLTVFNLKNFTSNYISNIPMLLRNGTMLEIANDPSLFEQTIQGVGGVIKGQYSGFETNPTTFIQSVIKEMIDTNVIDGGVDSFINDWIEGNFVDKYLQQTSVIVGEAIDLTKGSRSTQSARERRKVQTKATINLIKSLYGAGDNVVKVLPYLVNRKLGMAKADLEINPASYDLSTPRGRYSYEQAKIEYAKNYASIKTKRDTVDYSLTPAIFKKYTTQNSRMVIGDFVIHSAQWMRILIENAVQLIEVPKELKQLEKEGKKNTEYYNLLKRRQVTRLLGSSIVTGSLTASSLGVANVAGGGFMSLINYIANLSLEDDDELTGEPKTYTPRQYDHASNLAKHYAYEGSPLPSVVPIRKGDTMSFVNTNRMNINASLFVNKPLTNEADVYDWLEAYGAGTASNFLNFENSSIIQQIGQKILLGKDDFGNDLTNNQRVGEAFSFVFPRFISDAKSLITEKSQYGNKIDRTGKAIQMLTGFDVQTKYNQDLLYRTGSQYYTFERFGGSMSSPHTRVLRKNLDTAVPLSDSEITTLINKSINERNKGYNQARWVVEQWKGLGKSDQYIKEALSKGRNSKSSLLPKSSAESLVDGENITIDKLLNSMQKLRDKYDKGDKIPLGVDTKDMPIVISNYDKAIVKIENYLN